MVLTLKQSKKKLRNVRSLPHYNRLLYHVFAAIVSVTLISLPAFAQGTIEKAEDHYEKGKNYFMNKQYDKAATEFEQAYLLYPKAVFVWNVARSYEEDGDWVNSLKYFKIYLALPEKSVPLSDVNKKIASVQIQIDHAGGKGTLHIKVNEEKATVIIDKQKIGQSPLDPQILKAGEHEVQVEKPGFEPWLGKVEVKLGRTRVIEVNLNPVKYVGTMDIKVDVQGATVQVDDAIIGETPLAPFLLKKGQHVVTVYKEGMPTFTDVIIIEEGKVTEKTISLKPEEYGRLKIEADLEGATVTVGMRIIGTTPLAAPIYLNPGEHKIILSKAGFPTQVRKVTLEKGKQVTLQVTFDPKAAMKRYNTRKIWFWVVMGVGAATALGSIGYFVHYHQIKMDYKGNPNAKSYTKTSLIMGFVLVGVGVGLMVGSIFIYPKKPEGVEQQSNGLQWQFMAAPLLDGSGFHGGVLLRF